MNEPPEPITYIGVFVEYCKNDVSSSIGLFSAHEYVVSNFSISLSYGLPNFFQLLVHQTTIKRLCVVMAIKFRSFSKKNISKIMHGKYS